MSNGTGSITGHAVDALTNHGIAYAVVTLTSPSLMGEQTGLTDASGSFDIAGLPLGIYNIRVELFNYKPYTRGNLNLDSTDPPMRLKMELVPLGAPVERR